MSEYPNFADAMTAEHPSIVFYYGEADRTQELAQFDVAVIEPAHGFAPGAWSQGTFWLAYISIGEMLEAAPHFNAAPSGLLIGRNSIWKSWIIDQHAPAWPDFLVQQIAQPLWRSGYRGFFLDTVDSYQLLGNDPALRERQRQGLLRTIHGLRKAFPQAAIIMNRGFELLSEVHADINALAFESLYRGWDQGEKNYIEITPKDRAWLLGQAAIASAHDLPVISIDYCPPDAPLCAQATQKRILAHGLIPCIGDGHLMTVPYRLPKKSV